MRVDWGSEGGAGKAAIDRLTWKPLQHEEQTERPQLEDGTKVLVYASCYTYAICDLCRAVFLPISACILDSVEVAKPPGIHPRS